MRKPALIVSLLVWSLHSLFADTVVVFNEIMYHPATNEPTMEWVELHNQQAVDVDLSGWAITGGIAYSFASNTIVRGNGYLVVAAAPATLMAATGLTNLLWPFTGRASNAGDTVRLRNNSVLVMDEINYGVDGDWPVAPDGSEVSLAKTDRDAASGPAENWKPSEQMGGTPGGDNFPTQGFVAPSGLISWWNFNEASGPASDQASVNHGTLGSAVTRVSGTGVGGALSFNGTTNAYVNVGPGVGNGFGVSSGITIEAVLLPTWSSSNSAVIFRKAIRPPGKYRDTVLANNPVAYWPLDEGTTTINHGSGNGHNRTATLGVLLGQPRLVP